jgi:hypothetical protein
MEEEMRMEDKEGSEERKNIKEEYISRMDGRKEGHQGRQESRQAGRQAGRKEGRQAGMKEVRKERTGMLSSLSGRQVTHQLPSLRPDPKHNGFFAHGIMRLVLV